MRIRSILGALVIAALPFTSVWAENMTPEEIQKLVDDAVTKLIENVPLMLDALIVWLLWLRTLPKARFA